MKLIALLLPWLARAAAVLLAAGLLLRITRLRDSWPGLAPLFYATPWAVLALLALALAVYALARRRRCRALILVFLCAACATKWTRHSFVNNPPASAGPMLRFVYWNASRPGPRLAQRIEYLRSLQADVLVIGESNVYTANIPEAWRAAFPQHTVQQYRAGLLVILPEPPISAQTARLGDRGDYALIRCVAKGRALTVLAVDFESRPLESRAPPFARIAELVAAHRDEALIVAGDFNTPRESIHFDPLRRDFRHAFESAGRGLIDTWPTIAPVLSLDHVWLGTRWQARRSTLGWSAQSDHRAVIVDLALDQP